MNKNRGMFLETLINKTIIMYQKNDVAIFHKKPIPINFKSLKKEGNRIKVQEGIVASKSTTDYYGIYKGVFIAFEAKSTQGDRISLNNIKLHQRNYINTINKHGGVGFYIIGFSSYNEYFFVTEEMIERTTMKSLTLSFIKQVGQPIELQYPGVLDFVPILDQLI